MGWYFQTLVIKLNRMQKELDWLSLSRLAPNNAENIFIVADLLKGVSVTPEMFHRLPKSYLNKFFLTVRT